ncbi:hypothetical protein ACN20G_08725 [Streptomyces sp. BI20]|uniref:hypothetical protein n=1 Tax=Streptomyces sp. BI20 TaxID=3403460 RepID=UPI003C739418
MRLLIWQLSLPEGDPEPLYRTARKAGISRGRLTRCKRELTRAGYLHEWPDQGARGRWRTVQLVSDVPISEAEARALGEARGGALTCGAGASSQVAPSAVAPTVGSPGGRAVGRQPLKNGEKNTHPPTPRRWSRPGRAAGAATGAVAGAAITPTSERSPEPSSEPSSPPWCLEQATVVLTALSTRERRLRLSASEVRELAPLAARWFERGAGAQELYGELTAGLPPLIHRAAGLVRDRLVRKAPEPGTRGPARPWHDRPLVVAGTPTCGDVGVGPVAGAGATGATGAGRARVAGMVECADPAGRHTHPMLFRPPHPEETRCPGCRANVPAGASAASAGAQATR